MESSLEVNGIWKQYQRNADKRYKSLRDSIFQLPKNLLKPAAKEYFWALQNVSFKLEPGDSVGIIGRNGAGKSTLLKILSKITPPSKGEALINGKVASLLEVGTGFHPELTGRENIYFNGSILGMKKSEIIKNFDEIVAFSGIESFLDSPLKHYSSGMQMRLAFAVAAHLHTDILFIDEVLAVGDAEFQRKCIHKMEDVTRNEGKTILFVSHNITHIKNLCPKAIYLVEGSLKAFDHTEAVASLYQEELIHTSNTYFENQSEKNIYIQKCRVIGDIQTGAKCTFEATIFSGNQTNVDFAIGIRSLENQPIIQYYSSNVGVIISLNPGLNIIEVTTDILNISPNYYQLNLWLGQGGIELDYHANCMTIYINDGSVDESDRNVVFRGYNNIGIASFRKIKNEL